MAAVKQPLPANGAILAATEPDLGMEEWPGAAHNPAVLALFKEVGQGWVKDDETPWCAAWVGAKLASIGLPHTGQLNARSYMTWGVPVDLDVAVPGDVVVLWRGSKNSWQGHVGFFVRRDGDRVIVRGGNQGNKVSDAPYPVDRLLGVRRWSGVADDPQVQTGRPTLQMGNTAPDPFVRVLQELLAERRYFAGVNDGLFGPRTRAAVLAFQADNGLTVDGIVGPETWEALTRSGETRPERRVSGDLLAARGSRTVQTARTTKKATAGATAATAGSWVLSNAGTFGTALGQAETALGRAQALLVAYWPILAVIAAGVAVWWLMNRFEEYRVDDARSGANDRI